MIFQINACIHYCLKGRNTILMISQNTGKFSSNNKRTKSNLLPANGILNEAETYISQKAPRPRHFPRKAADDKAELKHAERAAQPVAVIAVPCA